ncbi:MAG: dethiobiotin synthase [Burkholderiales bacterium PBB1]|nr:MAG: dethiobiotin synthase [Burkholderiales bacterium PBB1]
MLGAGDPPTVLPVAESAVADEPEALPQAVVDAGRSQPLRGCFVTGTDTEVGKTTVTAGLLHALARQGLRVAGYKPVAAGAVWQAAATGPDGHWHNEDVEALHAASSIELTRSEVCPCLLEEACAPHLAARLEGGRIEPALLIAGAHRLMPRCDVLVVEGAGGFCVPLVESQAFSEAPAVSDDTVAATPDTDWGTDDLAVALDLPVILVVGLRLGCINHALLTAEAVTARGLRLAGWVANRIEPTMPHAQLNIDTLARALQQRHDAPLLGVVSYHVPASAAAVAEELRIDAVLEALGLQG